jgi:hypothetical protein
MSASFYVGGVLFQNGDTLASAGLPVASTSASGISQLNDTTSSTSTTEAATANAVRSAYDLANAALPKAGGTMTGDITFNAGQTFPGTVGDLDFQAKGDLVAGYGANAFGILPVGTNGQVLSANSACVSGLEWVAAGGGGGSGTVTSITAGTGLSGGTITTSGTVSLDSACVIAPSAYTAKGVILAGSAASTPTALTVGTNGQVLTANSACALGVAWAAAGGASKATPAALGTVYGVADQGGSSQYNTAIGFGALQTAAPLSFAASYNTAIGYSAGGSITTGGNCNTVLGYAAGGITTGDNNTVLGAATGATLTTGSNNTVIGSGASTAAAGTNNSVTLGNTSITVIRGAVTTITSTSDARDKTDIIDLPIGLEFVNDLRPVKFTWEQRDPNPVKDGTSEAGFLAQEVQDVQTLHDADEYLGLIYDENPEKLELSPGKLIPVLVKAIQELSVRVKQLEGNA